MQMADFSYSSPPVRTTIPSKTIRRRRLLFAVPAFLMIIIILYVLGYKAGARRRELTGYINQTNEIAVKSNKIANQLEGQLRDPKQVSKASFKTALMDMPQECQNLESQAQNMPVPTETEGAQSYLLLAMQLRRKGLEIYQPAISKAISTNINSVNEKDLVMALKYLALSDLAYDNFRQEILNVIKGEDVTTKVIKSKFINDPSAYDKPTVVSFLSKLKGGVTLQGGDIGIVDVATEPLRTGINKQTEVRILPATDTVNVRVEVSNNGKTAQKDIPVEVELTVKGKSQKKRGKILLVEPGQKVKITIVGFSPVSGSLNTFKVKAGPVFGEQNTADNYYIYKFVLNKSQANTQTAQPAN